MSRASRLGMYLEEHGWQVYDGDTMKCKNGCLFPGDYGKFCQECGKEKTRQTSRAAVNAELEAAIAYALSE